MVLSSLEYSNQDLTWPNQLSWFTMLEIGHVTLVAITCLEITKIFVKILKILSFSILYYQGWGLPKLHTSISQINFILQQYQLEPLNHIYIWWVSLQLSCSDTCQIWTTGNKCFDNSEKRGKQWNENRNRFSSPTPFFSSNVNIQSWF